MLASALRGQRRRLILLGFSSLVGGFAEAAVLLIIARVAVSIATKSANATSVRLALGPFDTSVRIGTLLAIGGALVLLRLALNAWQGWLEAAVDDRRRHEPAQDRRRRVLERDVGAAVGGATGSAPGAAHDLRDRSVGRGDEPDDRASSRR